MLKDGPSVLSTKEFSVKTGLPVSTITKMLRTGQLIGEKSSGKWLIPEDQLNSKALTDLGKTLSKKASPPSQKNSPSKKAAETDYSVTEFCQKTYLTEFGTIQWIKNGKLMGYQNEEGNWRVKAASFNLPGLQRLLRN